MKQIFCRLTALVLLAMSLPSSHAEEDIFAPYLSGAPAIAEVLSEETVDGVKLTRFRFESVEGSLEGTTNPSRVYAVMGRPASPASAKLPGVLICHGAGQSSLEEKVIGWAKLGYVALSPDLPGIMGYKDAKTHTRVTSLEYAKKNALNVKTSTRSSVIFDAVVAALKSFNLLASQPDVDASRLGLTGVSWGGYTVTMLGGLLGDRVKVIFSLYGSGFFLESVKMTPDLLALPQIERERWIRSFDPATRIHQLKGTYIMYAAANDSWFHVPSVEATYAAVQSPKYLCFGPNRTHWIDLPGGTRSWTDPTWTEAEPALFARILGGNQPPLPVLTATPGRPEFTIKNFPAGATPWVYCSTNLEAPWHQRTWQLLPAKKSGSDRYAFSPPDNTASYVWYGGVTFKVNGTDTPRDVSLTTTIQNLLIRPTGP